MTEKPEYRVYRARRGLISRLLYRGGERFEPKPKSPSEGTAPPQQGAPAPRKGLGERLRRPKRGAVEPRLPAPSPWYQRLDWRRILKWTAVAVASWLVLSFILFLVSAHIQSSKLSGAVEASLDDGGNMLTSPNNILVLGSDRRPGEHGPSRAACVCGVPVGSRLGGSKRPPSRLSSRLMKPRRAR